jgi:hypothetical protein
MTFSLDENKDIENILLNGFNNNQINFNDLFLLAKHYNYDLGHKKNKVKELLVDFSKEWDENFNEVIDRKKIDDATNRAFKIDIKSNKKISIFKSEIEAIEIIADFKYQKILFCILFISKVRHKEGSDKYYLSRDLDEEVIKLSKVNISKEEYNFLWQVFCEKRLLDPIHPARNDNNYDEILFAKTDGEIAFIVDNDNKNFIVQHYINYYGGEIFYCEDCGKKSVRKLYQKYDLCDDCYKEKRLEYKRTWIKNKRNDDVDN